MTFPTHFLLGMVIGKLTGNYTAGIAASVLVDVDHLQSYAEHGLLTKPKKLWKTVTAEKDSYGDQRGMLHNVVFFACASVALIVLFKWIGTVIVIGWFGHLLLDALDASDYWPLYPDKSINLKGPINYGTWKEFLFFLALLIIYLVT